MEAKDKHRQIYTLESRLCDLAYRWRTLHSIGDFAEANEVVQQYHVTMAQLWDLGWNANLDAEGALPDELMPAYFMDYWKKEWSKNRHGSG